jgi:hypothetical protein
VGQEPVESNRDPHASDEVQAYEQTEVRDIHPPAPQQDDRDQNPKERNNDASQVGRFFGARHSAAQ